MWTLQEEIAYRDALIEKVISVANDGNGTLSRRQLGEFRYGDTVIRLIDSYGGIWNPGASWGITDPLRATLSINTTDSGKYSDEEKDGGLWKYDYQSGGSGGKNTKMRAAMEYQIPLLWFKKTESGGYIPYKVYVIRDFPEQKFCYIAPDLALASAAKSNSSLEKRYAQRIMKQRLHQPEFRSRVLIAYETKCAICSLAHGRLLDAAHITPDSEESSSTSVTNGLSLCKIHHASYDMNILGIDPDFIVHVRKDILEENDGPMLQHGIKEMDLVQIRLPVDKADQPDKDRLATRFEKFSTQ